MNASLPSRELLLGLVICCPCPPKDLWVFLLWRICILEGVHFSTGKVQWCYHRPSRISTYAGVGISLPESPRCCLENLTSLQSLTMKSCQGIVSIPGDLWSRNLRSLRELTIEKCPDLVSIGGPEAIANINTIFIMGYPKLKELEQPLRRGNPCHWYVCDLVAVWIMIQIVT